MNRNSPSTALHPKWLVLIVVLLIGYGVLQPFANARWGWNLPSLKSLVSEETVVTENTPSEAARNSGFEPKQTTRVDAAENGASSNGSGGPVSPSTDRSARNESPGDANKIKAGSPKDQFSEDLLYGVLRRVKADEFVSPAGLRYTRGSAEGHRLDHLARHLEDQPDRPGRHGVFKGEMHQVLLWLDDAFSRANRRAKGTSTRIEDGRKVVEVTFAKPIGFIGGREGGRQGNPESKRLRMVLDNDRVITAFPF